MVSKILLELLNRIIDSEFRYMRDKTPIAYSNARMLVEPINPHDKGIVLKLLSFAENILIICPSKSISFSPHILNQKLDFVQIHQRFWSLVYIYKD